MKLKKIVLSLFMIAIGAILTNVRNGDAAEEYGALKERLDYLETRLSEVTSTQKEHGGLLGAIKGLQDRVSLGFGLRTSYRMQEHAAGSRGDGISGRPDFSKDFNVDNMRLYFGAKPLDKVYVEFNTEISNTAVIDDVRLLDAFVEYQFHEYFNLRMGRHLPASDRFNLDGPYYQNSFDFPLTAQRHPNIAIGRVEGASVFGQYGGGKFKWYLSAFEGREGAGLSNTDPDHLMYSGRVVYNFWEPESGFYNSSTYYGKKDVLALGLVLFHQSDGSGTAANPSDFTSWNFDLLMEKRYDWGTINTELAYFDYNTHGAGSIDSRDGSSWLIRGSYLYHSKVGWGYPQLFASWQGFDPGNAVDNGHQEQLDLGLHYIIKDHSGKIALTWSDFSTARGSADDFGRIRLGMQWQH